MNTNMTHNEVIAFLKNEVGYLDGLTRPYDAMSFTAKEAIADSKESLGYRLPNYRYVIQTLGNEHPVSQFLQKETEYYQTLIRGRGSIQSEIKHRLPAYRSLIRQLTVPNRTEEKLTDMKTKTFTNNDGKKYTVKADYFNDSIINQIINYRFEPEEPGINVGWELTTCGSAIVPDGTPVIECVVSSDKMKTFRWSMGVNKGRKFTVAGIFHKQV